MINDLHQKQLKNIVLTAKVHIKVQGNSHQRNVHVIKTALGINFWGEVYLSKVQDSLSKPKGKLDTQF